MSMCFAILQCSPNIYYSTSMYTYLYTTYSATRTWGSSTTTIPTYSYVIQGNKGAYKLGTFVSKLFCQ